VAVETTDKKLRKKKYNRTYYLKNKDKLLKKMSDRHNRLYADGICVVCGKEKALPKIILCYECKKTIYSIAYKQKSFRKEKGLCIDCGGTIEEPGRERCINCRCQIRVPKKRIPLLKGNELTNLLREQL